MITTMLNSITNSMINLSISNSESLPFPLKSLSTAPLLATPTLKIQHTEMLS